jgi:hypothetical protein
MSTRYTTRGSRAFWIALLILLPLPLGTLSGMFAYAHYVLGTADSAAGYWGLGLLALNVLWAMRLIGLARRDAVFDGSKWMPEYTPDYPKNFFGEDRRFTGKLGLTRLDRFML